MGKSENDLVKKSEVLTVVLEAIEVSRLGTPKNGKGKPSRDYLIVKETPEEIDEMLFYAEHATTGVVSKSYVEKDKKRFDSFAVLARAVMANEDKRSRQEK